MQVKENTPKAIILIIVGMTAVSFQDTLIKYISSETNIFLILLFRALLGLIFLSIFLKIKKEPLIFKTNFPVLTIIRVLLFYTAFILYFFSLTMIIQKKTSVEDTLYSQVFHIYIGATVLSILTGFIIGNGDYYDSSNDHFQFIFRAWSLNNINIIFLLFFIGIMGFVAFLCIFQAYRIGSPPSVAPFEYILIVWSLLLSWIIWHETLNFKGFVGLCCIVFGGLYTLIRERKKHVQITLDKPFRR